MDSDRLTYLFHRYVHDNCTEPEKAEFLQYVNNPGHEAQLRRLMEPLWQESSDKPIETDQAALMVDRILKQDSPVISFKRNSYLPLARIAASLALIVLIAGGLYYFSGVSKPFDRRNASEQLPPADPRFVELPDGSSVILNEGSSLDYPMSFDGVAREVWLAGEGYFDIAHDPRRPFIVHTGQLSTTVLGTAFNIRAYPDQSDITVTVTRGKVRVSDDRTILGIINPDQQITFDKTRAHVEKKAVDVHSVTSWMEKDIFFDDLSIGQALHQLEKRFTVSIELANEDIMSCRFTATFVKGEDIEQILRILCDFNNATLHVKNNKSFVIEGGECPV